MANKLTDRSRANRKAATATVREHSRAAEREALEAYYAERPELRAADAAATDRLLSAPRGGRTRGAR